VEFCFMKMGKRMTICKTPAAGDFRVSFPRSMNQVAQISNLLYRRFPIGKLAILPIHWSTRKFRRLEALRPAPKAFGVHRLEICATLAAFRGQTFWDRRVRKLARAVLLISMAVLLLNASSALSADATEKTKKLIAVLQSDSSLFDKARACQQLGEVGTPEAVPALAALLADPHLSAYARSGLEGIAGPSAAAALREAAKTLKAPLVAGVVNSLGVLRDPEAVPLLRQFATDFTSGVVSEALLALGNISTPDSIRFLEQALANGPETSRDEAAAACLLAADRQRLQGNSSQAIVLYDLIRQAKVSIACRVGATRGAILARKTDRVPFLIEQLRSDEPAIRDAALLTVHEIPDDTLATALNAELASAKPERQEQLLLAIGDCHNAQSIPAVVVLANGSNAELRKTALAGLVKIGPKAAQALLRALPQARPPEEKAIIRDGLRDMPGTAVDALLVYNLSSEGNRGIRTDVIRLLGSRGALEAVGVIMALASSPNDQEESIAALSALNSLAGPKELPELIALVKSSRDDAVKAAAENALAGVCSRGGKITSEKVLSELKRAKKASERNSWIRVLAQVGYAPALPAIEAAANDKEPVVAENALAQLGRWPDPIPIETLLKTMDSSASAALRKRALDSVLELAATAADEKQQPDATIAGWLQRANAAASSVQEKRRILGILGRLKVIESFRLLAPYLDNPDLRTEAAVAVVQIAPALAKDERAGAVKAALEKIAAEAATAELRERASLAARKIPPRGSEQ
jgi:HEAT repeat protein